MSTALLDAVLGIFSDQLSGWKKEHLEYAVRTNLSLARELQIHRSDQLSVWKSMIVPFKFIDRRGYSDVMNQISYVNIIMNVRKVNPELGRAVDSTPGGQAWLLQQIADVKALFI